MSGLAPNTQSAFGFPGQPSTALPCLNPHCKSHGKPHPNCRCYAGGGEYAPFSEGGEVGFCSTAREHNSDCEYFADGGEVPDWDSLPESPEQETAPDWDSLPEAEAEAAPSWDELPDEETPTQGGYLETAKAALEGISQGIAGPLAPMAQVGLGISTKEDIARRAEENPIAHSLGEAAGFVGSFFIPGGQAALVAKGASKVAKAAELGKVGSVVLKGALEASAFEVNNEMTKAFLGQGDPEQPVSTALLHVGAAGLMGAATGGVFSLGTGIIGKGMNSRFGQIAKEKADEFLVGLANSDEPLKTLGMDKKIVQAVSKSVAWPLAMKTGMGWPGYYAIDNLLTKHVSKGLGRLNPYARAAILKAASLYETTGVANAVHYATQSFKGEQKALQGMATLFSAANAKIAPPMSDAMRDELRQFIEAGQVEQQLQNSLHDQNQVQNFAKGGEVKSESNDAFSRIYPEQNTLLSTAKGRISKYLNSIRPLPNQQKLPFDKTSKNRDKHREYDQAIDLAINPLSILDRVNGGDLTPGQLKHFVSMYPEVYGYLSKQMTKKITESQMKGEAPPYKKRQAMSLFLGANLDSTFTPLAIQTIQGLYAQKKMAAQQQVVGKKPQNLTKTANRFQTDDQARQTRQQSSKA